MRNTLTKALLAFTIASIATFAADNTLGTWKLNTEKSKYSPAPFPLKSLTQVREASDGGVKVTNTGEQADGKQIDASYTTKYDGAPSSVSGSGSPYDTISVKQVNANTLTDERGKSDGKYNGTGRTVISNGGKTMTITIKGTTTDGKSMMATFVLDKQ